MSLAEESELTRCDESSYDELLAVKCTHVRALMNAAVGLLRSPVFLYGGQHEHTLLVRTHDNACMSAALARINAAKGMLRVEKTPEERERDDWSERGACP